MVSVCHAVVLAGGVQGGYTAYQAAFIFFQLPHGVFAVSVMTALLPPMSEQAVARDWDAFRAMVRRSRSFGFMGASCIHPGQVTIVNNEYTPFTWL